MPVRCDLAPAVELAGVEQPEAPVIVEAGSPHSPCPGKPHGGDRAADRALLRPGEKRGSVDPLGEVFIGPRPGLGLDQGGDRALDLPGPLLISVDSRRYLALPTLMPEVRRDERRFRHRHHPHHPG